MERKKGETIARRGPGKECLALFVCLFVMGESRISLNSQKLKLIGRKWLIIENGKRSCVS